MQVPPACHRADDSALLTRLADGRCVGERIVLDGSGSAYLVLRGCAHVFAVRRCNGPEPDGRGRFVGTVGRGCVVPSSTALGAWQLVLVPAEGTLLRPLVAARLHAIGYGAVAQPADPALIPLPRAVSVLVAALARGLDATLGVLADALRTGRAPAHAVAIRPGQIVSLDAGAAVHGDDDVSWLRVAGGHARRNGDHDGVFGGAEPALLARGDWIVVDGPTTAESVRTTDLLTAGQLPAALDQHLVLTLRSIDRRFS